MLHIKAYLKTKGTKKVSEVMTYTAHSKQSEDVLLMTCRVEVTHGLCMWAVLHMQDKILLDIVASTLLII